MPETKLRAKIQHGENYIHLGYFATKAQVVAAREGAQCAIQRWKELNPPPPPFKYKVPSPERLIELIELGVYDLEISSLAKRAARRHDLLTNLKRSRGFPAIPQIAGRTKPEIP